jgi:DMSO/TMAO reductase YedYZ molybdopterin-dependent catalytic subunit
MKFVGRWLKVLGGGFLAGLVAALFMTVVLALLRLFVGVGLPVELGGDRFLPTFDVNEFLRLLSRNGGPIAAKRKALLSGFGGQLGVGVAFGVLYAFIAELGRRRDPERLRPLGVSISGALFVGVTLVVIWAVTLAVLWPTLGTNNRGLLTGVAAVVTALGFLVLYASYGIALILVYRFITSRRPLREPAPVGEPIGRRAFLAGAGGVVLGAASGGLVKKIYDDSTLSYDGLKYEGADVEHITPNDRFYVVTKNIIDPNPTKAAWRLTVDGAVEKPRTYNFDDIASLPSVEQEMTLGCISNGIGGGLMSNAVWKGTPLRNLLEDVDPKSGVMDVLVHAVDGYTHDVRFEKIMEETTILAYEMNGEPLPQRHGYPARILVPGYYGEGSVKWINRIELYEHPVEDRYYGKQGWKSEHFKTVSRFDSARFDPRQPNRAGEIKLGAGETVTLRGRAFSGDKGISKVEVSTDGGQSWDDANIDYSPSRIVWAFWSSTWRPESSGDHELMVRATDDDGNPQIGRSINGISDGATGYDTLTANVQA